MRQFKAMQNNTVQLSVSLSASLMSRFNVISEEMHLKYKGNNSQKDNRSQDCECLMKKIIFEN